MKSFQAWLLIWSLFFALGYVYGDVVYEPTIAPEAIPVETTGELVTLWSDNTFETLALDESEIELIDYGELCTRLRERVDDPVLYVLVQGEASVGGVRCYRAFDLERTK